MLGLNLDQNMRLSREERRLQIKQVTLGLIGSKPLSTIRSAEIAASCGISEAALYKCFRSKDALIESLIHDLNKLRPPLPVACDMASPEEFRQELETAFKALAMPSPRRVAHLRLLLQISLDRHPLAREKYEHVRDGIWTFIENCILHGQKHWGFSKGPDAASLARTVYLGILMTFVEQEVFGAAEYDPMHPQRYIGTALDMMFALLAKG